MFESFSKAVHARFVEMSKGELFIVDIDDLFDKYLSAYPEGSNPILKKRTVHDCQCCKQFVRNLGKVVNIKDGKIISVWDNLDIPSPYKEVADRLSEIVRNARIKTVFRTKEGKYGLEYNYAKTTNERHDHFYGEVAKRHHSADPDTKRSEQEAIFQVMRRGLMEIKLEDLDNVLDLIGSNELYKGEENKAAILGFRELLLKSAGREIDAFTWENLDNRNARFRNTVIGTLFVDLAEGKELEDAVKSFETKVAPMNYKRPTAVITQKMVENAVQTLTDLGLGGAIYRRFAKLSDVSVNDVLFVDNESRSKMKDGVTLLLESSIKKAPPNLKDTVPITADEFIKDVLPKAKSVDLLLENRHTGNFVSLTGGDGTARLFKWENDFAWSYDGDVTDSVKQRVKAAGGNISAKLRVSLSWFNFDDLDLHAITPDGKHVHFRDKMGILDVDMNASAGHTRTPVENLAFNQLRDGMYEIFVNQFRRRETIDIGFSIEVEFGGVISQYSYSKSMCDSENVPCFMLKIEKGQLVQVKANGDLVGGTASKDKWGVKTETLVPVVAVMNSPNHWGNQRVGAKHLMFSLKDCKNPEPTRGIYNEFLRSDLDKHRKVFEVLGSKTKCPSTDNQVSGVGFTSARGDSVTIVVDGRRSYTVNF